MATPIPRRTVELLAPAKTAAIGREAILHGADAVYIGGPAFGARHNAGNGIRDIAELAAFAHRFHARVYVALNTILHDAELDAARTLARQCHDAGVDALIVQDMGLLELDLPPIDLHASTQCDIRTPEKARFLASAGFSQLVLARELSLAEIAAVRQAVPTDTLLEYFVHGALCVAFSGQCYISHAQTGRSANRGDCSQACRLPYTLEDARGRVVAFDKHLLSMKDNNQSANLRALIDAGISSFKIEGRYKEADYVKNVTGHYRSLLDAILEERSDLAPASSGRVRLTFTPDVERSFHRGATDYFAHGRQDGIGAFDTPTFIGPPLGMVEHVGTDSFDIATALTPANGDGIAWLHKRDVAGTRVNRVQHIGRASDADRWRLWPASPMHSLPGLHPGLRVHRNRDEAWEQRMAKPSAERRIAVRASFVETGSGFELRYVDEDGCAGVGVLDLPKEAARDGAAVEAALARQFGRLGDTDFELAGVEFAWPEPRFVPLSAVSQARRAATDALAVARLASHPRPVRRAPGEPPMRYPQETLSYLANVYNRAARAFYARHGVTVVDAAYEAHENAADVSLMITKHCLRHAFSLCPKQAKGVVGVQGQVRAEPMTLVNGDDRMTLRFDCKACEMHVVGRMCEHVLASPPPGAIVAPVSWHEPCRPAKSAS